MLARIRVVAVALALTGSAIVLMPLPAAAVVNGPCTAQGSADGQTVDLTTASEWHMSKNATATGNGHSTPELTTVGVALNVLGVPIPIFSKTGKGHGGDGPTVNMQQYSSKARVIGASGSADGGTCTGQIKIVFDDQSPTGTTAGMAGLIAAAIGAVGAIGFALARGCMARVMGFILGLIAGVGAGLYAEEAGLLDPFNRLDLLVPLAGGGLALLLGYLVQMLRHPAAPAAPAP